MGDAGSPLEFLAGHHRVTTDVECAHPDGGCDCARVVQVCAADEEDWPCERVRAFTGGRIAGLRQAAALLAGAAGRQVVPARRELLALYADECTLLAGATERRLVPVDVPLPAGFGVFGVDPPAEPPAEQVERFVDRAVRGRRTRRGSATGRLRSHDAFVDLDDRVATLRAANPDLDTVDVLLAAARMVENLLRFTVGLPPHKPGMPDIVDDVLAQWGDCHPLDGPGDVAGVLLDFMVATVR